MRYQVNSPQVISETIEQECIIIHLGTGTYYSLQGSGSEVWDAVAGAASVPEIAADLAARYAIDGGEAQSLVSALVDELVAQDLISPNEVSERQTQPQLDAPTGPFVAPTIAVYTDMQDLVLLDPVHEVTETGWPERKAEVAGA